jgi:hypothetical protein
MSRCAMWVAGNSVVCQDQEVSTRMERVGWSAALQFGPLEQHHVGPQYFHFPIPTPALLEGKRATLVRVMILFQGGRDVNVGPGIDRVDVWDGGRLLSQTERSVAGDYSDRIVEQENVFDVGHDGVTWGVGVSVLASASFEGEIRFFGAGADFDYDL